MAYVYADIIGFTIWVILFFHRKDLHHEMVLMSILATPLAIFDILFVPTYWQPVTLFNLPVGIEGFIYTFFLGGISAVAYAEITKGWTIKIKHYHKHASLLVLILIIPIMFSLKYLALPNLMINLYIALLVGISLTVFLRKDLLKSGIIGGITFGGIYFVSLSLWLSLFPQAKSWFIFQGLPRIFIFNVPLWELIFGILFATYWGNIYELCFGYKFKRGK